MTVTRDEIEAVRRDNLLARERQAGKRSTATNRLANFFAPVTLTVPFAYLVPDNAKYGVMRGRMLLRAEYRQAKGRIWEIAKTAMHGEFATDQDVTLHARLFMPDKRRRDATNYAKLCQDALQGAVYADDTQIKRATWENAGIDRANPRCEIEVRAALTPSEKVA